MATFRTLFKVAGGKKSTMVLISTESDDRATRQSICLNSEREKQFKFDLKRPQLCQVVGHRFENGYSSKIHKWQSLVPVRADTLDNEGHEYPVIQAGYQMLLIRLWFLDIYSTKLE